MRKAYIIAALIILIGLATSFYFYNSLPAQIATHWNAQGIADGYGGKIVGLFLIPFISIAIFFLYLVIPHLDPLRENIQRFRGYYDLTFITIIVFMLYVHVLTIIFNLGYVFNFSLMIVPAIGVLLIMMGFILQNSRRNWFVGIRTPWTLSSDEVWRKTHILGGKLFKISGVITLIGLFFPKQTIWFVISPILISAIVSIVYSYIVYRQLKKK